MAGCDRCGSAEALRFWFGGEASFFWRVVGVESEGNTRPPLGRQAEEENA